MKVTAIVPSLNPDEDLINVVDGLIASGFEDIVLVEMEELLVQMAGKEVVLFESYQLVFEVYLVEVHCKIEHYLQNLDNFPYFVVVAYSPKVAPSSKLGAINSPSFGSEAISFDTIL